MGFAGGGYEVTVNVSTFVQDFWSDVEEQIDLPAVAADIDLPDIEVSGLPIGGTFTRVVLILKTRTIENTNAGGTNGVNGAQTIKVKESGQAWGAAITAIDMVDDMWAVAAAVREAGDVVIGDNDIKAIVNGNGTYNIRWVSALVDLANLRLNDVQVGFRMFWEVE